MFTAPAQQYVTITRIVVRFELVFNFEFGLSFCLCIRCFRLKRNGSKLETEENNVKK